ncbi:Eukaryotic translation initiation factor 2A [Monoraphidium neglectum]|uniref:Eukaryotic translation initiation factor 2A n=1 Tax=Monoraphidium neglectum TaxID=145388 RepID=A0A0D2LHF2_9CHLO|nr:Eukaryotic translation initiation factor 2A [Monoraphidium neglectum]KIY91464.1 Eukaryotic translation initiation factor 2A [Monoraphidium neglectum]|eukprot:XP_013890484.1 Eukaryotic translation initiation factor 2A [Monoraphidium neglectum]
MPAKVTLFDDKCKPVYDLGGGPYNTVIWNPFGRFLAIAGFGNLPGDLVFWSKLNKGACKQIAATRSEAVNASWSPCGRYVMTSTVAPRLRVDNNVKVFTYYGEKVAEKKFDVLLEAQWLPAPSGTFEDRPASPRAAGSSGAAGGGGGGGAAAAPPRAAGYSPADA